MILRAFRDFGAPPRQYAGRRVCEHCGCILNKYNPLKKCLPYYYQFTIERERYNEAWLCNRGKFLIRTYTGDIQELKTK